MVFHRLIQGPRPRLRLLLNGRAVEPTPSRSPQIIRKTHGKSSSSEYAQRCRLPAKTTTRRALHADRIASRPARDHCHRRADLGRLCRACRPPRTHDLAHSRAGQIGIKSGFWLLTGVLEGSRPLLRRVKHRAWSMPFKAQRTGRLRTIRLQALGGKELTHELGLDCQ